MEARMVVDPLRSAGVFGNKHPFTVELEVVINWPRPDERPQLRSPSEDTERRRLIRGSQKGALTKRMSIYGYPLGFYGFSQPFFHSIFSDVLGHSIEDRIKGRLGRRPYNHLDTPVNTPPNQRCGPIGKGPSKPGLFAKEPVISLGQSRKIDLPSGNLKAHHTIYDEALYLAAKSTQPSEHL